MRWVIQRVLEADVRVNQQLVGQIGHGLLILCGIEENDTESDADWLIKKTIQMRIFSDAEDKMNLSVLDVKGSILFISQFTLHALTAKGNRPSFIRAANPDFARKLYTYSLSKLKETLAENIQSGAFGADMKINSRLDGPVTIIVDSKSRE